MKLKIVTAAIVALMFASCGNSPKKRTETPTRGYTTILVDETVYPMIDGQVRVFENQYPYAKFGIIWGQEQDVVKQLIDNDTTRIAVMARDLNQEEKQWFESQKLPPVVTEIAYDAIALVVSRQMKDSTITLDKLRELLRGETALKEQYTLVFDNPRSSTLRCMMEFAETDSMTHVYALESHKQMLEYVSTNPKAIGFVGVDWLYEADADDQQYIKKLKVLGVGNGEKFSKPTQNDIAENSYPFIRKIVLINCQGTAGLGMGMASFIAGDVGQRIILKSGLVPVTFPKREINIIK